MATNQEIAHNFFYSGFNKINYPDYKNCGYRKNVFLSYGTAIAKVVEDKHGETVCLLSGTNYSRTTSRHITYLHWACPYRILFISTNYGESDIDIVRSVSFAFMNLEGLDDSKLTLKAYRDLFIENYKRLEDLLKHFEIELTNEQKDLLPKYKELFNTLQDSEAVKNLKAREAKKAREKAKEQKQALALLLKEKTLGEIAYTAYASTLPYSEKDKLRKLINPQNDLSFVWLEGDQYRTSQGITIDKREGDLLLKLYRNNRLQHGYKISIYTVLSVCADFVTIGCHKIPARNLQELAQ